MNDLWYKSAPKVGKEELDYGKRCLSMDWVFNLSRGLEQVSLNPLYHSFAIL